MVQVAKELADEGLNKITSWSIKTYLKSPRWGRFLGMDTQYPYTG
jgi:hypothetical protein